MNQTGGRETRKRFRFVSACLTASIFGWLVQEVRASRYLGAGKQLAYRVLRCAERLFYLHSLHDLMQTHALKPPQMNELVDLFEKAGLVVLLCVALAPELIGDHLG